MLSAEEFAIALKHHSFRLSGVRNVLVIDAKDFDDTLAGKRGIMFFKDFWQRTVNGKKESFRNRSGDHIDLWNGNRMTDWKSWLRIHFRICEIGLHDLIPGWSDLEESKSIWFWQIQ